MEDQNFKKCCIQNCVAMHSVIVKLGCIILSFTDNGEPALKRSKVDVDFAFDSGASMKVSITHPREKSPCPESINTVSCSIEGSQSR